MSEDRSSGEHDLANLDTARAAKEYLKRGWRLAKLQPGGKRPASGKGWQHASPGWTVFAEPCNIGVQLGERSGHLVDLDLDCEEARELAGLPCLFGDAPSFGRSSFPADAPGHRLVICSDAPQTIVRMGFSGAKGKALADSLEYPKSMLLEIRGNGQTAFPPSMLDGNDHLVWRKPLADALPTVAGKELERRARMLAFCTFACRIYPGEGDHHDFCLAVAGVLAHLDVDVDDIAEIIDAMVTANGDDVRERRSIASDTASKHMRGEHVTGLPHFLTLTGLEEHERMIRGWLALPEADGAGDPHPADPNAIRLDRPELHIAVGEVERLLIDKSGRVFNRNGELVRLRRLIEPGSAGGVKRAAGMVQIVPALPPWLAYEASQVGGRFSVKGNGAARKVQPSAAFMATLIAVADDCHFLPLTGVSLTPLIHRDQPGYDDTTGIYLDFAEGVFPAVPMRPSREEAIAALERLSRPLRGFPFVESFPTKAACLAAMIAAVIRSQLRSCPMFLIDAPTAGSGKSKLAEAVGLLALGVSPSAISFSSRPEENEKRLSAVLRTGEQVILIDNVTDDLEGNFLCSMLTSETVQPRILGLSETVKLGTRTLVLATGNNIRVRGDLARRALLIRLDLGLANPDDRRFDFDPIDEVRRDRPALVMDALTVVRGYIAAGRLDTTLKPFGSFPDFDLIRGALRWLGMPDPAETRDAIKDHNAEGEERVEAMAMLIREVGLGVPFTVQTIGASAERTLPASRSSNRRRCGGRSSASPSQMRSTSSRSKPALVPSTVTRWSR